MALAAPPSGESMNAATAPAEASPLTGSPAYRGLALLTLINLFNYMER